MRGRGLAVNAMHVGGHFVQPTFFGRVDDTDLAEAAASAVRRPLLYCLRKYYRLRHALFATAPNREGAA